MSPNTTAGQIFCVFFALVGIPLNMLVLNRVGKYMLVIERNISNFLEEKMGKMVRISNHLFNIDKLSLFPTWENFLLLNIDHIFFPLLTSSEMYLSFCLCRVLLVRSSPLFCCAHDYVSTAGGLDLLPSHLLLLYHPQHNRLRRLCGRYNIVNTDFLL